MGGSFSDCRESRIQRNYKALFHEIGIDLDGSTTQISLGLLTQAHDKLLELVSSDSDRYSQLEEALRPSLKKLLQFDLSRTGTLSIDELFDLIHYFDPTTDSKCKFCTPKQSKHYNRHAQTSSTTRSIPTSSHPLPPLVPHAEDSTTEMVWGGMTSEPAPLTPESWIQWLFKATDLEHNQVITAPELAVLFDAIAADGINPSVLDLEPATLSAPAAATPAAATATAAAAATAITPESSAMLTLNRRVMSWFDTSKTGFMSASEFLALAQAIQQEYAYAAVSTTLGGSQARQVGPYLVRRTLGLGCGGLVKYGYRTEPLEPGVPRAVALKILRPPAVLGAEGVLAAGSRERATQEVRILRSLEAHPNIVGLYERFDWQGHECIAMQLCGGGTLEDFRRLQPVSEASARFYFYQLCQAVEFMHRQGIAHLDIRLANCLLDNSGDLQLSDFGHAGSWPQGVPPDLLVGSLHTLAPEQLLARTSRCTYMAQGRDIWCLGLSLYHLLTGRLPFDGTPSQIVSRISSLSYQPLGPEFSSHARRLMCQLLSHDANDRPSVVDILHDPFFGLEMHRPAIGSGVIHIRGPFLRLERSSLPASPCQTPHGSPGVSEDDDASPTLCSRLRDLLMQVLDAQGLRVRPAHSGTAMMRLKCQHRQYRLHLSVTVSHDGARGPYTSDLKVGVYMRRGVLWEFWKVFRRIEFALKTELEGVGMDSLDVYSVEPSTTTTTTVTAPTTPVAFMRGDDTSLFPSLSRPDICDPADICVRHVSHSEAPVCQDDTTVLE